MKASTPLFNSGVQVQRASSRLFIPRLVAAVMMLAACSGIEAQADGKFFPLVVVGGEDDPTIPYQRAMIAYRDGVETLVVESTVDGKGDALGWVIPLPAEPTLIESAKAGTLESVYKLVGPRINASGRRGLKLTVLLLILSLLSCAVVAYDNDRGRQSLSKSSVLVLSIFLFYMAFEMLPALGVRRAGLTASASVLQEQRVGSYEVSIITGDSAEPIRAWLTENGFRVPESTLPVLDEYAKSGWCFSAARIATEGDGLLTPHPLKFVFKTAEPVYPMKLTGVDAGDLQLDLYVVADRAAKTAHMDRISCDIYRPAISRYGSELAENFEGAVRVGKLYQADDIRISVGHPDTTALMWPGCTLTHLRGTLAPPDMADDMMISWVPTKPTHKQVFTHHAAMRNGWMTGMVLGVLILLPASVVIRLRMRKSQQKSGWLRRCLIAALGLGLLGGSAAYAVLPKVVTSIKPSRGWRSTYYLHRDTLDAYSSVAYDMSRGKLTPDIEQFDQWWAEQVDAWQAKWSQRLKAETRDIPGGYEVERNGTGWTLTLYDRYATPIRLEIRAASEQPEPTEPSE